VSSSVRMDGQAKTLGEYLRAKMIQVPAPLAAQAVKPTVNIRINQASEEVQ
jgi:hypothetical protein